MLCTFKRRLPSSIDETAPYKKNRRQSRFEMATFADHSDCISNYQIVVFFLYKPFLHCIQTLIF